MYLKVLFYNIRQSLSIISNQNIDAFDPSFISISVNFLLKCVLYLVLLRIKVASKII